tara:strand:+ start:230 stop:946 length:717 start_codon:yes stop_codon:yes gene_type:complete
MISKHDLKLDWCGHDAAKYATKHWHYSGCMPQGKMVRIGVWEFRKFIGVVLFGSGAAPNIGKPFGLKRTEICELTRVALNDHESAVSRIVAVAIKMLKQRCPGLNMIVSFADTSQGHHGGIYQAGGWVYLGQKPYHAFRIHGRVVHPKTLHSRFGKGGQSVEWLRNNVDPNTERFYDEGKHKYAFPLTDEARSILDPMRQPYPQRATSADSGTPGFQPGGGGANPTVALSFSKGAANG